MNGGVSKPLPLPYDAAVNSQSTEHVAFTLLDVFDFLSERRSVCALSEACNNALRCSAEIDEGDSELQLDNEPDMRIRNARPALAAPPIVNVRSSSADA